MTLNLFSETRSLWGLRNSKEGKEETPHFFLVYLGLGCPSVKYGAALTLDLKCLNFNFCHQGQVLKALGKKALENLFFHFLVYYDVLTSHKTFPGA